VCLGTPETGGDQLQTSTILSCRK